MRLNLEIFSVIIQGFIISILVFIYQAMFYLDLFFSARDLLAGLCFQLLINNKNKALKKRLLPFLGLPYFCN